jgi:hypothetical protein
MVLQKHVKIKNYFTLKPANEHKRKIIESYKIIRICGSERGLKTVVLKLPGKLQFVIEKY